MFNENFNRHENKYMVSSDTRATVERELRKRMMIDNYGETDIVSVYYDDDDFSIISRSNEKPLYKEKLRLRGYGSAGNALVNRCFGDMCVNDDEPIIFAELKKKFKGIVYKRRVPIPLSCVSDLYNISITESMENAEKQGKMEYTDKEWQIGHEIQACMDRHPAIAPAIATICKRIAYKPLESSFDEQRSELRFTFDSALKYANMRATNFTEIDEIDNDMSIMEIKCIGSYPMWLSKLLSSEKCYPQSFSKCGTAAISIVKGNET